MELFFRWSDIPIDSCPFNQCLSQANSWIVFKDVLKKKWTLTGTVGSGGFGLIYFAEEQVELAFCCRNQNLISDIQGGEGRKCVVKIEPHENGPLFVEWHYYLAAGRWSIWPCRLGPHRTKALSKVPQPMCLCSWCSIGWTMLFCFWKTNYLILGIYCRFLLLRNMFHLCVTIWPSDGSQNKHPHIIFQARAPERMEGASSLASALGLWQSHLRGAKAQVPKFNYTSWWDLKRNDKLS